MHACRILLDFRGMTVGKAESGGDQPARRRLVRAATAAGLIPCSVRRVCHLQRRTSVSGEVRRGLCPWIGPRQA